MNRQTSVGQAPVALMCETLKVRRSTFYAATQAAKSQPPSPSARPMRPSCVSAAVLREAIERIVKEQPAWGHRKVWATLRREKLRVGRRRVYETMKAMGLTFEPHARRPEVPRGRVTVPEPNRRWATDLTTVWTRQDGLVAVVLTVDCGCRSVLDVRAMKSQGAPAVLGTVRSALIDIFTTPSSVPDGLELRTDHGPQYTGADAAFMAQQWGLQHTFAPVGRPTGNAVAERTIQTMKLECVWQRDWDSLDELHAALQAWRKEFNEERPHQALKWSTPSEWRAAKLGPARAAA